MLILRRVQPGQQAGLDQHLESVADADNQLAVIHEPEQFVKQVVFYLVGQDRAGAQVVAVSEPARNRQDIVFMDELLVLEPFIDMNLLGLRAGLIECRGSLVIAVYPGCP